ncbi:MAG: hypothetical protein NVS3B28_25230 [Candidatus Velthaea sp.]
MRVLRRCIRRPLEKLMRHIRKSALALALLLVPIPAYSATPTPSAAQKATKAAKTAANPPAPERIDVTKLQPKQLLPKTKVHTEFMVEVNKLGQVARVRSGKSSKDLTFNAQTYGNALQAFIRTPEGQVVVGLYRLTYDYDPKTARVHRDVELVKRGGVDPDAKGAAADMLSKAHLHTPPPGCASPKPGLASPQPAASVNPQRMPDLNGVMKPTSAPTK